MLKKVAVVAGILGCTAGAAMAGNDWPALPDHGFISGRTARVEDVKKGDAVFATQQQSAGKPLPVQIPQYAYLRATHRRVIVVQAEEANGTRLFGVRGIDGKESIVTADEIELLGTQKPADH